MLVIECVTSRALPQVAIHNRGDNRPPSGDTVVTATVTALPIVLSVVLNVRCSLLMSVLVAEPNQTIIDEHRTVSMKAE